jgi:transposase-like protein
VRLKIPKLRQQTFETAIIERYRRRESSVEEALIRPDDAAVRARLRELAAIRRRFGYRRLCSGAKASS